MFRAACSSSDAGDQPQSLSATNFHCKLVQVQSVHCVWMESHLQASQKLVGFLFGFLNKSVSCFVDILLESEPFLEIELELCVIFIWVIQSRGKICLWFLHCFRLQHAVTREILIE